MNISSELCHVDSTRIIVRITASENQREIGSALGQGANVYEAEENAIQVLRKRINGQYESDDSTITRANEVNEIETTTNDLSRSKGNQNKTKTTNHLLEETTKQAKLDWTEEIAQIDSEIERIGWKKEQESEFLKKLLGYSDRSRITDINDINLYIYILKKVNKSQETVSLDKIFNNKYLISLSDNLIHQLNWDTSTARNLLKTTFNKEKRSELTAKQLFQFNYLLEQKLLIK